MLYRFELELLLIVHNVVSIITVGLGYVFVIAFKL